MTIFLHYDGHPAFPTPATILVRVGVSVVACEDKHFAHQVMFLNVNEPVIVFPAVISMMSPTAQFASA